jgi:hypothetical protein
MIMRWSCPHDTVLTDRPFAHRAVGVEEMLHLAQLTKCAHGHRWCAALPAHELSVGAPITM